MFNKYYQEELAFLKEMGREFALAYPAAAHFLAERGADPDVERLLEGFAFLTGRVRQKLDDELPEVVQTFSALVFPHYLRPIPAMAMVEFTPLANVLRDKQRIPRHTEVASVAVEGTPCRFRTCYDVDLLPLAIEGATLETAAAMAPQLRVQFRVTGNAKFSAINIDKLRLYLHGDQAVSYSLFLWLARYLDGVSVQAIQNGKPGKQVSLRPGLVTPGGFGNNEALLPYSINSFAGYRLLQEYFTLPAKFMFIDVGGISAANSLEIADRFDLVFRFANPPAANFRVTKENIRLNCTPVVNLFPNESDPIRLENTRVEHRIRPAGYDPNHADVYSVERVVGIRQGASDRRLYVPFFSFAHGMADPGQTQYYHQTHLRPSVVGDSADMTISFGTAKDSGELPENETISLELMCTNRKLPLALRVGDIKDPTANSPSFATFRNISTVTAPIQPPIGTELHWRLISHLALNHQALGSVDTLRGILDLYNFQALADRQAARENQLRLAGIKDVKTRPIERLYRGAPIRGLATELELDENSFAGEGDMYLFASILNELFALYVSINSLSQLTVRGAQSRAVYTWKPKSGAQTIL